MGKCTYRDEHGKNCTKCDKYKTWDQFYTDGTKGNRDGRNSQCKQCISETNKAAVRAKPKTFAPNTKNGWFWNDANQIREALALSASVSEVLARAGIKGGQSNYDRLRRACEFHGIEMRFGREWRSKHYIPDEQVFVENSTYIANNLQVKERLLNSGRVVNVCALCGPGPEWNDQLLVLQLDHINGVSNDHRYENLRLLCPNCHTQTPTYAGRRHENYGLSARAKYRRNTAGVKRRRSPGLLPLPEAS